MASHATTECGLLCHSCHSERSRLPSRTFMRRLEESLRKMTKRGARAPRPLCHAPRGTPSGAFRRGAEKSGRGARAPQFRYSLLIRHWSFVIRHFVDTTHLLLLFLAIGLIAFLYSSVGHAGASGYIAIMTLFAIAPTVIRPTALVLNILVASIGAFQFWRAGHFSWRLFWPFA